MKPWPTKQDGLAVSPAEATHGGVELTQAAHDRDAQAALAQARVARRERETSEIERRDPLRRRILQALADDGPATPTDIRRALDSPQESISRYLRKLARSGLVQAIEVQADKRQRLYELTREGEAQLGAHRAFGKPEPTPQAPTVAETVGFLRVVLRDAVAMRRRAERLQDATANIRIVMDQANRVGSHELAVEATAELATMLRLERRTSGRETRELLSTLEQIALGRHSSHHDPQLALPAAAHRAYTLGHLPEADGGGDPAARASHLDSAQFLYGQLADSAKGAKQREDWRRREAWSIVSLATNLRDRTKFEDAFEKTRWAMSLFEKLEDPFGQSRCLFMFGFCLRIMGDFDDAWRNLSAAHALACTHEFERFKADLLTQMGEVRRCQGQVDEARELLGEALERAARMDLLVAQAFAQSALGAVEYQERRMGEAQAALTQAHSLFEACGRREGLALKARRQAIVARHLADVSRRNQIGGVRKLIRSALERYQQLGSPAGMMACEIESARLSIMSHSDPSGAITRLIRQLDDTQQCNLLELDPWVPTVLAVFAEEAGDERLREPAQGLLARAEQRLTEWTKRDPGRATRRRAGRSSSIAKRFDGSFEMGGETRRQRAAPSVVGLSA
jgi:DNA-binding MarR family transcriptional regulator